ncbi:MAG: hypothetical protein JOY60_12685 [Burkholderiaceae bacterium]|nr:hypothetical protein [Burkholderiaceae bacterium]
MSYTKFALKSGTRFVVAQGVPQVVAELQYPTPSNGEEDTNKLLRLATIDLHWKALRELIDSGEYVLHDAHSKRPIVAGSGHHGSMLKVEDLAKYCGSVGIELSIPDRVSMCPQSPPSDAHGTGSTAEVPQVDATPGRVHSNRTGRKNVLTSLIEQAEHLAGGESAAPSDVWNQLRNMVESDNPPPPLVGLLAPQDSNPGGVQYRDSDSKRQTLTYKSFSGRLSYLRNTRAKQNKAG